MLWRSHARSEVVPFVICGSGWLVGLVCVFHRLVFVFRFVHLVLCLPDVLCRPGFREKLSLMSPPRWESRSSIQRAL